MIKKNVFYGSVMIAGLAAFGLGCNPNQSPVSLDKYQVNQQPQQEAMQQDQARASSTEMIDDEVLDEALPSSTDAAMQEQTEINSTSTIEEPTSMDTEQQTALAFPGVLPGSEVANKQIRIKTDKGDIVFELLPKEGPNAASNFFYLVNRKFYDGLNFHRVEPGFVIQGGDPLGNGTGGPGYKFADDKVNLSYNEGIVAMANSGPNTNGSQFFIMLANTPLPPSYSIFGRVTSGMDVVKKIAVGDKMTSVTVETLKK
ncbi:MAG: peptidylprolyl isomerase [Patescibacteria group bacterium]|nr:peptidylprolyl isomerase [Patescibacteria group bacterium]